MEQPEFLDLLPEPNREPILRQALIELNGSGSILSTIGCECWESSESYGDSEHHRFGAYVATHFREDKLGKVAEDCFVVFFQLAQALGELASPEPGSVKVLLTLKQFGYLESNRHGWQMELTTVCTWNNPVSAKTLWDYWFPTAVRCLMDASLELEHSVETIDRETSAPTEMSSSGEPARSKRAKGST